MEMLVRGPLCSMRAHVLPKAKGRSCFPQLVNFLGIVLQDEIVVDHEERVCRDVLGKRRVRRDAWHDSDIG